jgi:hypothetical protein
MEYFPYVRESTTLSHDVTPADIAACLKKGI